MINALRSSDVIWGQRSWSTLVQVMVCCLTTKYQAISRNNVYLSSVRPCDFHMRAISQKMPKILIHTMNLKKYVGELLPYLPRSNGLTHWGRVTHIYIYIYIWFSKLITIGSDNGLSPGRCQAIIWTNDGILFIGSLGTNFNDILIEIYTFSCKKMHLKMSSGKCRPFCPALNVLTLNVWGPS